MVDEVALNIHPLLLGAGTPLFVGLDGPITLALKEARPLKNGCVIATYRLG